MNQFLRGQDLKSDFFFLFLFCHMIYAVTTLVPISLLFGNKPGLNHNFYNPTAM